MGNDQCWSVERDGRLFQLVMTGQSITDGPIPGRFRRPLWALINHRHPPPLYNTYSVRCCAHCNRWLLYSPAWSSPALRWLNRQDGILLPSVITTCCTLGLHQFGKIILLSTLFAASRLTGSLTMVTMVALVLFASQRWSTLVNNGEQSKRGGYGDSREETDKVGVSDLHSLNSFHHLSSDNTGYVISYSLISSFHHLMRKWAVSS